MYSTLTNIQQIIGKMMSMIDVKNSMLKNLNVTRLKERNVHKQYLYLKQ